MSDNTNIPNSSPASRTQAGKNILGQYLEKHFDKLGIKANIEMIFLLHKMLFSNINDDMASRIRNDEEWVKPANHNAPNQITELLEELLIKYYSSVNQNIIKRIALMHLGFNNIRPFVDGNARIGRILNNYILIREGYVPINIKFTDKKLYNNAFQEFDLDKKTTIMEEIIGEALTNSTIKDWPILRRRKS